LAQGEGIISGNKEKAHCCQEIGFQKQARISTVAGNSVLLFIS
jgi:hypothetical protein